MDDMDEGEDMCGDVYADMPPEVCWAYDPCSEDCPTLCSDAGSYCPTDDEKAFMCEGDAPSCEMIIKMVDLDCDEKIVKEEWTAMGNCHSPEDFEAWDLATSGDGKLDLADCEQLGAEIVSELGEIAMNPSCGGDIGAEPEGSGAGEES